MKFILWAEYFLREELIMEGSWPTLHKNVKLGIFLYIHKPKLSGFSLYFELWHKLILNPFPSSPSSAKQVFCPTENCIKLYYSDTKPEIHSKNTCLRLGKQFFFGLPSLREKKSVESYPSFFFVVHSKKLVYMSAHISFKYLSNELIRHHEHSFIRSCVRPTWRVSWTRHTRKRESLKG